MIAMDGINQVVAEDAHRQGTLTAPYIEVGALVRGSVLRMFAEAEGLGAVVTYRERKFVLSSIYTNVEISGPAWLLKQIADNLNRFDQ